MKIASLHIYPVKSMRGIVVDHAVLDARGLLHDRHFMVVDSAGCFVTQRELPALATINTSLADNRLVLTTEKGKAISVGLASDPAAAIRKAGIWKHKDLDSEDCGDEVASWLSEVLQGNYRLVRAGAAFNRSILKAAATQQDRLAFADGAPVLVCSTASLEELNRRIRMDGGTPVPMARFRPNIVVSGCDAFSEDDWPDFEVGNARFRNAGPSERCAITTTDQLTGIRGKEPLRTLATFRRLQVNPNGVFFGTNYINESKTGMLRIGDPVTAGNLPVRPA